MKSGSDVPNKRGIIFSSGSTASYIINKGAATHLGGTMNQIDVGIMAFIAVVSLILGYWKVGGVALAYILLRELLLFFIGG